MRFVFSLLLILPALVVRADLILEQQYADTNGQMIGHTVLLLRGEKMRLDQREGTNSLSVIINLETRDSWTLMPETKSYIKRSGADVEKLMANRKSNDEMNWQSALPEPTGVREKVGDYETEIYHWRGAKGQTEKLWVATNFVAYAAIREDLAKLDRFNDTGPHRNGQPQLSRLPGMVIKTEIVVHKVTTVVTLVSAKEEPLDEGMFELPGDYIPWKPPVTNTNAPATSGH